MDITNAECEAILEKVSGSSNPIMNKIDELICAIQSKEKINYIEDEE